MFGAEFFFRNQRLRNDILKLPVHYISGCTTEILDAIGVGNDEGDEDDELIFCIRYPALDSIRSDPRYADLMRPLGLPE